jgi:two-component system, NtrC family, response regulator HydG
VATIETKSKILLVDDEEALLRSLRRILTQVGYEVREARSGEEALRFLEVEDFQVILLDLRLPGMSGLEALPKIKALRVTSEVILMTGFATVDDAVAAVKAGAYDFLTKPFDSPDVVILAVAKASERRRLVDQLHHLEQQLEERGGFEEIVGQSSKMRQVFRMIESVSPSSSTVLILGESGTGKELVARAIHARSLRQKQPFLAVNCAALPGELLESELFGTVSGAFTGARDRKGLFEAAHRGTLFLDEVGELPLPLQAKLLRALQEGEIRRVGGTTWESVDVRVIAATNVNLTESRERGTFREDLFYRLNVLPIRLPPLRERREDVPLLAAHFLQKYARRNGKKVSNIEPDALARLQRQTWMGNVRELENTLERALVICQGSTLTEADLLFAWEMSGEATSHSKTEQAPLVEISLPYVEAKQRAVESFDRAYVTALMRATGGNVSISSQRAGLDRSNFRRLLRRYDLKSEEFRKGSRRKTEAKDL